MNKFSNIDKFSVIKKIKEYLEEDIGYGDITSNLIQETKAEGEIIAKSKGIICGIEEAKIIFDLMKVEVLNCSKDGEVIEKGDVVVKIAGDLKDILGCERTILNLMMRMSSIASSTHQMADLIKDFDTKIAATRKTTPGFRVFEKRAVVIGGGDPHRWRLDDMILLKDTHLDAIMFQNSSLGEIIKKAKLKVSFSKKVEVEVENGNHALEAAKAGADIIMFDNMKPDKIKETIEKIKKFAENNKNMLPIFEASGNITLKNVLDYAKTGVNIISSSEITLYPPIKVDLSLKIKKII